MRLEADLTNYIQNRLEDVEIFSETQSTRNIELDGALKTASKSQTGNAGYPDHIALVNDFILVMEDKSDRLKLVLRDNGQISQTVDATTNYALNGALFYALKILDATHYKKIFAFGNVGDRKHHIIKPIFIDGDKNIRELPEVDTFKNFTAENIESYYRRMVLKETPPEELELRRIIRYAETLHEHLRNYGALGETEKPRVVSAILLALAENKYGFNINQLTGDQIENDGAKIFSRVEAHLKRANVRPEVKRDQILEQFNLIKTNPALNAVNVNLGRKTPLRFFTEFIHDNIYDAVINNSAEDYLGRFYGEFISYSGGDGQSLGVVLTPRHITELFCDLVDLKPDDVVFDPCCGTGGFLISAMNHMLRQANESQRKLIKKNQLHGIELRPDMFSTATTNMILRGDGKSNLICDDFFAKDAGDLQLSGFTVGFMNPPYSQAKNAATAHLSEINFVRHLLDSITCGGRVAAIVPVSAMIGKNKNDKVAKQDILRRHTLEGVISLNKDTFYGVGTVPCIVIFTAGEPHPKNKRVKFINFEDDGFEVKMHVGLVETERAKDKKFYLLDCWRGKIKDAPSKFMVETTIEPEDEWLHSFYYYNDEQPAEVDFTCTVADYLTFEFNMIAHGRGYLFKNKKKRNVTLTEPLPPLADKIWRSFRLLDYFDFIKGDQKDMTLLNKGDVPIVSAKNNNNGYKMFVNAMGQKIFKGHFLTINNNGDGGAGISYYQSVDVLLDNHVTALYPKFEMSRETMLFISRSITNQREKFGYGYTLNNKRLNIFHLMFPVNDKGEPDFKYMEAYIQQIEEEQLQRHRDFVQKADSAQVLPLNEKLWREFFIGDLFRLETGKSKGLNHLEQDERGISYLGATNRNNGVLAFVKPVEGLIQRGNCIAFIRNGEGSVGYAVYKREDFIATSDITCGYGDFLNEYVGNFIVTASNMVRGKYSFNYKRSDTRLRREKINLPVNDAGEPDFDYMEAYMRNETAKIYRRYLAYVDGE